MRQSALVRVRDPGTRTRIRTRTGSSTRRVGHGPWPSTCSLCSTCWSYSSSIFSATSMWLSPFFTRDSRQVPGVGTQCGGLLSLPVLLILLFPFPLPFLVSSIDFFSFYFILFFLILKILSLYFYFVLRFSIFTGLVGDSRTRSSREEVPRNHSVSVSDSRMPRLERPIDHRSGIPVSTTRYRPYPKRDPFRVPHQSTERGRT